MKHISLFAILFFAFLSAFSSGCSATTEEQDKAKHAEAAAASPAVTETFLLKKEKFSSSIQIPGELIAFQQVDLYAKVAGFVKTIRVDIGSQVREGQLLMLLEAPELSSQASAAASRLRSLEAVSVASTASYKRLLETSKTPGTISPNDLDIAASKKDADLANLEAARSAAKEISIMQGYLEIRAPFSGVITARNVNPGALVGPSGKGAEQPLLVLQEQQKLRLAVSIPEAYTGYLKQDSEISFTVRSRPSEVFKAKVKRMAGALDLRLRSERIEMDVINDRNHLLPGTVAEVTVPLSAKDSTFVVPKTAVVNSTEAVYVIRVADGKAGRVGVRKGREIGDKVEVFGELRPNDVLVVKGSEEIREGTVLAVK